MIIHICDRCRFETKYDNPTELYEKVRSGRRSLCEDCRTTLHELENEIDHWCDAAIDAWAARQKIPPLPEELTK